MSLIWATGNVQYQFTIFVSRVKVTFSTILMHSLMSNSAQVLTSESNVWIIGKSVIDWPNNLIHALHIGLARIELGIDKQDPLHHLPVSL